MAMMNELNNSDGLTNKDAQPQKTMRPAAQSATLPAYTDTAFGGYVRRTYNDADGGGSANGGHDRGQQTWFRKKADGSLVEETPQSEKMRSLMNQGVTSQSLQRDGKTWEQAITDVQNANSDKEAKRLANQAQFMQMKRDERVKRRAEMHKEAYGVAKYAYDQLLGGGGEVHESKDGKKCRVVKISGSMLEQTNANRLNMGNGDKIKTVFATISLGADGKTPYGEARFDFVVEQGGNVKAGGQKTWRTMTLDQIRGNYGKALGNSGGNAKDADAAFGEWKDRMAANAQKDFNAANPDGGKMQQIQAASDAAIKLENVKAQNALNLFMKQAENERTMLEAKLKHSGAENDANIASKEKIEANRFRADNIRSAQSMVQGMITALIKDGVEVTDKMVSQAVAVARQTLGLEDYGGGAANGANGASAETAVGTRSTPPANKGKAHVIPTPEQQKAAQAEVAKRKAAEAKEAEKAKAQQAQGEQEQQIAQNGEAEEKLAEAAATKKDEQKPILTEAEKKEFRKQNPSVREKDMNGSSPKVNRIMSDFVRGKNPRAKASANIATNDGRKRQRGLDMSGTGYADSAMKQINEAKDFEREQKEFEDIASQHPEERKQELAEMARNERLEWAQGDRSKPFKFSKQAELDALNSDNPIANYGRAVVESNKDVLDAIHSGIYDKFGGAVKSNLERLISSANEYVKSGNAKNDVRAAMQKAYDAIRKELAKGNDEKKRKEVEEEVEEIVKPFRNMIPGMNFAQFFK